jgi:hypothetical protein
MQQAHLELHPHSPIHIEARALAQLEGKTEPLLELAGHWLDATAEPPAKANFVDERLMEFSRRWAAGLRAAEDCLADSGTEEPDSWRKAAVLAAGQTLGLISRVLNARQPVQLIEPAPADIVANQFRGLADFPLDAEGRPEGAVEQQLAALRSSAVTSST